MEGRIDVATELMIPHPGRDLIPDGWWKATVVPWADEQIDEKDLQRGDAKLAALEAAMKAMGLDAVELMKGRRYIELDWGKLLGKGKRGGDRTVESKLPSSNLIDKFDRHRFRQLAAAPESVMERLEKATEEEQVTRAALLRVAAGPHIGHNAGENEWYTPREYIEAAREVMGEIDLDPASSEIANSVVRAKRFYADTDDGLEQDWEGRVFMNPPYASELIKLFIEKFCDEVAAGHVTEGIVLVNNATETAWFASVTAVADRLCLPLGRIKFWNPDKKSTPLQGQAILYSGENGKRFAETFKKFGPIWRK